MIGSRNDLTVEKYAINRMAYTMQLYEFIFILIKVLFLFLYIFIQQNKIYQ